MITEQNWADAEVLWDYLQMHQEPRPCSVGIALGSHDLGVADVAADLYHRGMFPLLVVTGANSPTTTERMPRGEATHYRERAMRSGVPDSAIIVEPYARNTGENVQFSRTLLGNLQIPIESALLISKPYEERRAYATARQLWPETDFIAASTSAPMGLYFDSVGDAALVIDMMVGAAQRLLVYAGRYLEMQSVPDAVLSAYQRLRQSGHVSRLAKSQPDSS